MLLMLDGGAAVVVVRVVVDSCRSVCPLVVVATRDGYSPAAGGGQRMLNNGRMVGRC